MNSVTLENEPFSTTTPGESTIRAAQLIVLLFVILVPQIAWGFNYVFCGNGDKFRFSDPHITMERQRNDFPDGSDKAIALKTAADRWNLLTNVQLTIVGSNSTTLAKNGVNEIGFDKSAFADKPNTPAFTQQYTDLSTCKITEADMYWNPGTTAKPILFHALEDAQHSPYVYGPKETLKNLGGNMVGATLHELGHVLGLQHNNAEYNIMGDDHSHVNRNGDITYYGPGLDGAAGARFLYPPDPIAKFFDLGASIFAYDGPDGILLEYSSHAIRHWKNATNGPDCSNVSYNDPENPEVKIFVKDGVNCYDVDAGTTVQVPFTFENNSKQEETFEAVFYNVYISSNNFISDSDTLLIRYSHHLLRYPGLVFETFLDVPIPAHLNSGSNWYLGVIIERQPGLLPPGSVPNEVDYRNNAAWYPFTVVHGNDPPITPLSLGGPDLPLALSPDESISFTPRVSDPNGDPLSYSIVTFPIHGSLTPTSGRYKFVYTPTSLTFVGNDSFQYRAEDPYGLFTIGEINVLIERPKKLLIVNKFGAGGRVISNPSGIDCGTICQFEFADNAVVDLTAIPDKGHVFDRWDVECKDAGTGTCTVPTNTFRTVSAHFKVAPTSYALTIGKTGSGSGTITSNPAGIDCGEDCTEDYPVGANAQITLTPHPDAGSTFRGWNGACSGTGACTVSMYADQNITATFATATPTIFTVNTLDESGTGSMRQAILDANANAGEDTILFQRELKGTITLTSGQLAVTDSVVIEGPGANVLAISSNNASRIFKINPGAIGTVAINGLTLKEGNDVSGEGGGAVIIDSGTVTINNCTLSNNSAGIDNKGGGGGAIRKFGPGKLTVSNSTVSNNSAIDQFGQGAGGGIRNDQETLTIINSTVSGNFAASGGGIAFDDGRLTISNSTVTGNSANLGGGGVFTGGGELILGNSLVAGNKASTGDKEIQNTGTTISQGHNLFGEKGASGVSAGTTLVANDLILAGAITTAIGPLADNGGPTQTHLPVAGGPAIDAGNNSLILQGVTTDQRGLGFPRIVSGTVDIGAVEKIIKHTLSISKTDGNGTINSKPGGIVCGATCSVGFISGTAVTLTATPDPGYLFTGWGGACSGPATTCTLAMNAAKNVTASFVRLHRSSWKRALIH